MKRLCVFCGSRTGAAPIYAEQTRLLGASMVRRGFGLVFGAGHVGLMGVLADAVREQGGETIGVIPQSLVERELAHQSLTDLRIVESMHERKAVMADLADAFLALPGGYGTLDELFEILIPGRTLSLPIPANRSACSTSPASSIHFWPGSSAPSRRIL